MKRRNKAWEAQLDIITKKLVLSKEQARAYKRLMRNHAQLADRTIELSREIIGENGKTGSIEGYMEGITDAMYCATESITKETLMYDTDIAMDLVRLGEIQKKEVEAKMTITN